MGPNLDQSQSQTKYQGQDQGQDQSPIRTSWTWLREGKVPQVERWGLVFKAQALASWMDMVVVVIILVLLSTHRPLPR